MTKLSIAATGSNRGQNAIAWVRFILAILLTAGSLAGCAIAPGADRADMVDETPDAVPTEAPDAHPVITMPADAHPVSMIDAGHDSAALAPDLGADAGTVTVTPEAGSDAAPVAPVVDSGAVAPGPDASPRDRANYAIEVTYPQSCTEADGPKCGAVLQDNVVATYPIGCFGGHWSLRNGTCSAGCTVGKLCGP